MNCISAHQCTHIAKKFTALFLVSVICQSFAYGYSQNKKLSINVRNAPIQEVVNIIEKQSDLVFVYQEDDVKNSHRITLKTSNTDFKAVLNQISKQAALSYRLSKNYVFLTKADTPTRTTNTSAQQHPRLTITGSVTDASGEPLIGVSVIDTASPSNGTITNTDGQFSLKAIAHDAVLSFSLVGYKTQLIPVEGKTTIHVTLEENVEELSDVVVVAYGTQKKTTLTGAVAAISTKEIKQSPAANLAVTLTGRLPGLFTTQRSGEPGRDQTLLYMRGRATTNGQSPLIMVDGVERDLTSISPDEVESVSILKDASSTALYGVRGANGVILVTTKRGTKTIPDISLNAETGYQTFTRWPSYIEAYDWALLKNEAWHNDNPSPTSNQHPPYSDFALERYRLNDWPQAYSNKNWIDELMHKWVPQTRYNMTLNGKGANVGYFVNVAYLHQGGQWKIDPEPKEYDPSNYLNRYSFRSNIDAKLNESGTIKMFLNAAGYFEQLNGPFVEDRFNNESATVEIISRLLNSTPSIISGPLTPDGEVLVGPSPYHESPWAYINRSGYRKETRNSVVATFGMEFDAGKLVQGLSGKLMASFDTRAVNYMNGSRQYQWWERTIDPNLKGADGRDSIYYSRTRIEFDNTPLKTTSSATFKTFYDVQLQLNYNRTFADVHDVIGMVVATQQSRIEPGEPLPYNVRGLAGRISYAYANKYITELNAGYNGSEQFAPANRYGFFPSFSAAWNIAKESFFADSRLNKTINNLKLRASIGKVGNDKFRYDRFLYLDKIKYEEGNGYSSVVANGHRIVENYYGNPRLQWETALKMNMGVNIGLFNDLEIVFDYFKEKREKILIERQRSIPILLGVPSNSIAPWNIGRVDNHGFEIEATYTKSVNKDLFVVLKGNFNYSDNKVIFADELMRDATYAYQYQFEGFALGQQFGLRTLGYFKDQEEINNYPVYEGNTPRPGDLKYEDVNQDNIINEKDYVPIGYSDIPKYSWGTAMSINYKGLDLSVLFQGAFKISGVIGGFGPFEYNNFRDYHRTAWTKERADSGAKITFPALSLKTSASETRPNDFFIQDRSFIRLKNLEIGYTLPSKVSSFISAKSIRVYANGLNLFTWDKLKFKDWDPELMSNEQYPILKVINIGANITF